MDSYHLKIHSKEVRIYIHDNVLSIWRSNRQLLPDSHESFGVLIGSCSYDKKEFWIESVTTPCPKDTRSRYSFHLKDMCHQKAVQKSYEIANGQSVYFGTWHTHPEKHPTPSLTDKEDWQQCIKRNKGRPLVFVIVGTDTICLYRYNDEELESFPFEQESLQ